MPNAAQSETYERIRSLIGQLRGPQSYVPLPLDQVSQLSEEGERALFHVGGARVFIERSGNVVDTGLPDCPRYASGLLSGRRFLPAVAADLLMPGNSHKADLANHSHTPDSFIAYLRHGTALGEENTPCIHQVG